MSFGLFILVLVQYTLTIDLVQMVCIPAMHNVLGHDEHAIVTHTRYLVTLKGMYNSYPFRQSSYYVLMQPFYIHVSVSSAATVLLGICSDQIISIYVLVEMRCEVIGPMCNLC